MRCCPILFFGSVSRWAGSQAYNEPRVSSRPHIGLSLSSNWAQPKLKFISKSVQPRADTRAGGVPKESHHVDATVHGNANKGIIGEFSGLP